MTEHRAAREEFHKAGARIQAQRGMYGSALNAAAAWLLRFIQDKTEDYSFGEWADRWQEIKRFAEDGGLGPDEPPLSDQAGVRLVLPERLASPFTASRAYPGPGEKQTMEYLRVDVRRTLDSYLTQGWATSGLYKVEWIVRRDAPQVSVVSDLYQAFLYQAFHLLGEVGPRIRRCQGCGTLFLAGRTDKQWCSGPCQAATWKRTHPTKQTRTARKPK